MSGGEGAPRHRIERAPIGYRVRGPGILIWEPTLDEARARRDELELGRWRAAERRAPLRAAFLPHEMVYGPVRSRRLGRSLGVDLSPPGCRVCSFDCVYCTARDLPRPDRAARWPEPREVRRAIEAALARRPALDSVTISGHGEPTFHPRFPEVVDVVLGAVAASGVRVPVRILTNGTQAVRAPVRRALDRLAERIVKLDADAARIDRPLAACPPGARLVALGLLRDVTLQSCFVDGVVSNVAPTSVRAWAELVGEIAPRGVQIYTIDERPPAVGIRAVGAAALEEIACELRTRTGIEARVFA